MEHKYPDLILPKPHLSYTQLTKWKSNKEGYKREYFENGRKLDTKFLRFGKNIAQLVEEGKHKILLPELETYDAPEYEIRIRIAGVPCLSFLDTYDTKLHIFREYKTGKRKKNGDPAWSKSQVQKHEQLVFYATSLKWKHGKMPERCYLDWIETVEDPPVDFWREAAQQLRVTGTVISFERIFDEREIERMEKLIVQTAWEISDAYQDYINEL